MGLLSSIGKVFSGGLGDVLGAAGEVAGALGKGKGSGPTQISGFASLPPDIRDYLTKDILPKIKNYGSSAYQGIPRRRLNASDLDPVFGSKARQDLQAYKDMMASMAPTAATTPPAATTPSDSGLAAIGRLFLQTNPMMLRNGTSNEFLSGYNAATRAGIDPEKVTTGLGKAISAGNQQPLIDLLMGAR